MPYDPDWDLEEEEGASIGPPGGATPTAGLDYVEDSKEDGAEDEADQHWDDEERRSNSRETEDMEVDVLAPSQKRSSPRGLNAAPTNRLPFPGAASLGRLSQVEVVLHPSPKRKDAHAPVEKETAELVTSDLVPAPGRREAEAARTTTVPQPAVPFPLPIVTPQPKKRGRPFGWTKGSGSYSAMKAGLPPGSSTPRPKPKKPAGEQKPRGRPGRKSAPTARQIYLKLNPHFVAFRCEWEKCPAELQNLETLRRHLLIVHGRPSSSPPPPSSSRPSSATSTTAPSPIPRPQPLTCKWAACPAAATTPFPTRDAFAAHIEQAHLTPFLWHVGDGPRNGTPKRRTTKPGEEEPLPRYLFSLSPHDTTAPAPAPAPAPASGTGTTAPATNAPATAPATSIQVTPSIRTQQIETDEDRRRRAARLHRVLAARDAAAPDEPEYTGRELAQMAAAVAEKRARQRMLRDYAAKVCGGGAGGGGEGGLGEWKGLLAG